MSYARQLCICCVAARKANPHLSAMYLLCCSRKGEPSLREKKTCVMPGAAITRRNAGVEANTAAPYMKILLTSVLNIADMKKVVYECACCTNIRRPNHRSCKRKLTAIRCICCTCHICCASWWRTCETRSSDLAFPRSHVDAK